jgi:hypothetical protein
MGIWTDAVNRRAMLIHEQLCAMLQVAEQTDIDKRSLSQPYLDLLSSLYSDEFPFAQLADTSDLIAHFDGPAVSLQDPPVSLVASAFTDIRDQIRGIAKSVAGLSNEQRSKWPSELDPFLSGLAHGSLIIGVRVPRPEDSKVSYQLSLPNVTEQLYQSVRSAVISLSNVSRFIESDKVSDGISEFLPDPAVRDTVMVAASKLAPSGRKGITSLSLIGPATDGRNGGALTPESRKVLNRSLTKPAKISGSGTFDGVVRQVDLDSRRFEIRRVRGAGAIRCMYEPRLGSTVKLILDSRVAVEGDYEVAEDSQPRLIQVKSINVLNTPAEQLLIDNIDGVGDDA